MRYLLDTHTILWYFFGDSRLSENARKIIESKVRNLPFQNNVKHNDPFDRILISQAINNDMTIITCDDKIPLYDENDLVKKSTPRCGFCERRDFLAMRNVRAFVCGCKQIIKFASGRF